MFLWDVNSRFFISSLATAHHSLPKYHHRLTCNNDNDNNNNDNNNNDNDKQAYM